MLINLLIFEIMPMFGQENFLEIKSSSGLYYGGSEYKAIKEANKSFYKLELPTVFMYGTENQIREYLLLSSQLQEGKLKTQEYKIFYERMINNSSIGASIKLENLKVYNISNLELYLLGPILSFDKIIEIGNDGKKIFQLIQYPYLILSLLNTNFGYEDELYFLDIYYGYHFIKTTSVDPYLRFGIGIGTLKQTKSSLYEGNIEIGNRFYLSRNLYLGVGLGYDYIYFPKTKTNLNVGNLNIQIGYRF